MFKPTGTRMMVTHKYSINPENATTSTAGFMSAADKVKLDALDENDSGGGGSNVQADWDATSG